MNILTGTVIALATLLLIAVVWLSVGYKDAIKENAELKDKLRYARYENTLYIIRPNEELGLWVQELLWKSYKGGERNLNKVFQMKIGGKEVDFGQAIFEVSQNEFEAHMIFKFLRLKEKKGGQ